MPRNPLKDLVAVVGVGRTAYTLDSKRSLLDLGLEAARKAIEDAGLTKDDIDGICGNGMSPVQMHDAGYPSLQGGLGIHELTWMKNGWIGSGLVYTAQAVHSGLCDYALVVQVAVRYVSVPTSSSGDPFRQRAMQMERTQAVQEYHELWHHTSSLYPAMLGRYLLDYGAKKEQVGLFAVNNRAWAMLNPAAALREPLTIEDYLGAEPVVGPFGVHDMDFAIEGAEALVVTTSERAKDLPHPPVLIHAASLGAAEVGEYYENVPAWERTSPWVAGRGLRARSDIDATSVDLFYPYDGSTTTALTHLEASGFCEPGEGAAYLEDSWDPAQGILTLGGHTRVGTNGGSMAHGRLGGFNSYTEATIQLRGDAEPERQVRGANTALCSIGSLFHDPAAVLLRTESA